MDGNDYEFYEVLIAGVILFAVGSVGTICNLIVAIFTRKLPSLNNAYGWLSATQALAEAVICALFTFYFAPMMVFDIEVLKTHAKEAGFIILICYDICLYSHIFIAINRFCAICWPFQYDRLFSKFNTGVLVVIAWIAAIIVSTVLFKLRTCDLEYVQPIWAYVFSQNEYCEFVRTKIILSKDMCIIALIAILDVLSVIQVYKTRISMNHVMSSMEDAKRHRKEINFLKQAILQAALFVVELLGYMFFAWYFTNRWIIFGLTTFAWTLLHSLDGIIIIAFNREFRRLICQVSINSRSQVTPTRGSQKDTNSAGGSHSAPVHRIVVY